MCTRSWLQSAGRSGDPYHQAGDGQVLLRSIPTRKSLCRRQTAEEDNVKISVREVGAAKVVEVEGEVDLGTSPALRRILLEVLPTVGRLALNLGSIRYIDSSGIATLIEVLNRSQHLKKEFVLFGLSPAVQEVFLLTHVVRIFQVFQRAQEAIGTS